MVWESTLSWLVTLSSGILSLQGSFGLGSVDIHMNVRIQGLPAEGRKSVLFSSAVSGFNVGRLICNKQ